MKSIKINSEETIGQVKNYIFQTLGLSVAFYDKDKNALTDDAVFKANCSREPYNPELIFFEFARLGEITKKFYDGWGIKAEIVSLSGEKADENISYDKYIEKYKSDETVIAAPSGATIGKPVPAASDEPKEPAHVALSEIIPEKMEGIDFLIEKEKRAYSFNDFLAIAEEAAEKFGDKAVAEGYFIKAADKIFIVSDFKKLIDSVLKTTGNHGMTVDFAKKALQKSILSSDKEYFEKIINEGDKDAIPEIIQETAVSEAQAIDTNIIQKDIGFAAVPAQDNEPEPDTKDAFKFEFVAPAAEEASKTESDDFQNIDEIKEANSPSYPGEKQKTDADVEDSGIMTFEIIDEKIAMPPEGSPARINSDIMAGLTDILDKHIKKTAGAFPETGAKDEGIALNRTFDEYRHKAAALLLNDNNYNEAVKNFKYAERKAATFSELITLTKSVKNTLEDTEWALRLCQKAQKNAVAFSEIITLAECIIDDFNDKKWALSVMEKAKAKALDFNDYNKLGDFASKKLFDNTIAAEFFKTALKLGGKPKPSKQPQPNLKNIAKPAAPAAGARGKSKSKTIFYIAIAILVIILSKMCD